MDNQTFPAMITQDELACQLGVSKQTLFNWRLSRKGPPHVRIGSRIRYRVEDVKAWIASNVSTG